MRYVPVSVLLLLLFVVSLPGCGGLELNPLINEHRTVRPEIDRTKSMTVSHDLVLDDKRHPSHELHLSAGLYALEGEDEEYWFLRSPVPLKMRDFHGNGAGHGNGPGDEHSLRGGIALGKYSMRSVPAAVYIDGEATGKVMIWKLGKDFMDGERRDWTKSF